jgi:hypothetical protein
MPIKISSLILFTLLFASTANSKEDVTLFFINKSLDGAPCKVYFFKRWGTYEHPVKPLDPISYSDALQAKGYCRAWMCESAAADQFLFFEAIKNEIEITSITKDDHDKNQLTFYNYQSGSQGVEIQSELTLDTNSFLASLENDKHQLTHIQSSVAYSYRYHYAPDGKLKKVDITDIEGNLKTLHY